MKYFWFTLKVLLCVPLLLIAVATFLSGAYLQTISLLAIMTALFYWPFFTGKKRFHLATRTIFMGLMILLQFTLFRGEPKQSIYLDESSKDELYSIYIAKMNHWPEGTEQIFIDTEYGKVHVLAYGDKKLPPILLFHAASMAAHSWAENINPLMDHFRIYAIDNIGEGNLSELKDALVFPETSKEIADLYAYIVNELGVVRSPVIGASNGGYIAQAYAHHYPEKVESIILSGPMGLTPLSGKSIFMLSVASLYPLNFIREKVAYWAFGDDRYCHEKYGDWFEIIMKGTIPSVAQPRPLSTEQKKILTMPILLFLGNSDPIVGDAEVARTAAEQYPDIDIHILSSGHLIAVEQSEYVNRKIVEFLHL
jgi:pimeloyl-ACP methyl ester carboxylesterase